MTDFYEEDEPLEDIKAAWRHCEKGKTGLPMNWTLGPVGLSCAHLTAPPTVDGVQMQPVPAFA